MRVEMREINEVGIGLRVPRHLRGASVKEEFRETDVQGLSGMGSWSRGNQDLTKLDSDLSVEMVKQE